MISIDDALQIILDHTGLQPVEEVPLLQALGRTIAGNVSAPRDIPSANNSAMDGYAFSINSLQGNRLKVSGFLPAGDATANRIESGEAIKIMTGAPIPPDCDTVVPIEDVTVSGDFIQITGTIKQGCHIRQQGEELKKGEIAIKARSILRAQEIGMLASFGNITVPVYRRPRVGILATGDELIQPGLPLQPGKQYNSNSYSIACQAMEAGAEPVLLGITADRQNSTKEEIMAGMENDILITSGGVSVGDRDYVKEAITGLGGELLFWKVDLKPGKPFAFGILNNKPVFALPGNPVAAMVVFELFVRPALLKLTGHTDLYRTQIKAVLTEPLQNRGDRPHLVSVHATLLNGVYSIKNTGSQGSARISALIAGNGLVRLEPGVSLAAGDAATVMLLSRESGTGID